MTERLHFHFSLSCIGEGNGNPFQCSCLENPRDGGTWWAAIYGVAQSRPQLKRLSSSSSSILQLIQKKNLYRALHILWAHFCFPTLLELIHLRFLLLTISQTNHLHIPKLDGQDPTFIPLDWAEELEIVDYSSLLENFSLFNFFRQIKPLDYESEIYWRIYIKFEIALTYNTVYSGVQYRKHFILIFI